VAAPPSMTANHRRSTSDHYYFPSEKKKENKREESITEVRREERERYFRNDREPVLQHIYTPLDRFGSPETDPGLNRTCLTLKPTGPPSVSL